MWLGVPPCILLWLTEQETSNLSAVRHNARACTHTHKNHAHNHTLNFISCPLSKNKSVPKILDEFIHLQPCGFYQLSLDWSSFMLIKLLLVSLHYTYITINAITQTQMSNTAYKIFILCSFTIHSSSIYHQYIYRICKYRGFHDRQELNRERYSTFLTVFG